MTLFKRHIGRRVAGVGIGVALLVLGLEAPAFAAPAITAISPTSGPAASATSTGCVVAITGTGFDQAGAFAIATVRFTGAASIDQVDAIFHVVSDTVIWTTVPLDAKTGAITVSDGETPPATSNSAVFTITTGVSPDPCAPTIASFTPTCGVVGTAVAITGTNLLKSSGDDGPPVVAPAGGEVRFNPYDATGKATPTGAAVSPTTISVNVPSGAKDGPIKVFTFTDPATGLPTGGTATSTASFDVVTDPTLCAAAVPTTHSRSVTLSLRKHLVARGKVSVGDGFTDCAASVPVKIQRRRAGGWRTVGSTTTTSTGAYSKRIRDRAGKYRAKAPKVSLGTPVTDICSGATSPVRRNT